MVFSSLIFLFVFMPLFFLSYFAVKNRTYKNVILLIFSVLFYAWGEPKYVFLILIATLVNYIFARYIQKARDSIKWDLKLSEKQKLLNKSKYLAISAVTLNILVIVVFKYLDFLIMNFNSLTGSDNAYANIPLPIGISFFTFQIISYIIDVYKGKIKAQKNIIFLGAYISAFPQLIAGPIVRYETIEDELTNRLETSTQIAEGIRRFAGGLNKKVLISHLMAQVVDIVLRYSNVQYKMLGAIIIAVAYTLQIYFDFSGYSDMAIGLGKIMGFNYNENFNYPYISKSVTEFWRRWHISLSSFFKDYVYIPLGGNRCSASKHICNILIVWLLTGLWHGADWNFVLWGLYYGILLIIEKYIPKIVKDKTPSVLKHIFTILIIIFGWVIFKFTDPSELNEFIKTLFGTYGFGSYKFIKNIGLVQIDFIIAGICGIMFSAPIVGSLKDMYKEKSYYRYIVLTLDIITLSLFVLSVINLAVGSFNPFIYYKF